MCRILKWTFVLIILAACGQEVDVAEIEPLRGEPVCVGHHSFVVPEGMNFRVRRASIDGQRIIILPSDGRSARAQMDRHGQQAFMGEPVVDTDIGPWAFTIFDGVGIGEPDRYEIGSLIVDDKLVLTFTPHTKSLVPDLANVAPRRMHNALRVAPYTGQREGLCLSGLVFYGHPPERGEVIDANFGDSEHAGVLQLRYGYGEVQPRDVFPMPDEPPEHWPAELRRQYQDVRVDSEYLTRNGQKAVMSRAWGVDKDGANGEARVANVIGDRTRPYIWIDLDSGTGTPNEWRELMLGLLAGLKER